MINDPSTLLALLLFVGTIGLMVLILPLLILFWSQLEPQLVGMVVENRKYEPDEYGSQSVLPQLMKSFGNLADETKARKPRPASAGRKKAASSSKPKSKVKPAARKSSATSSRSKATTKTKAVTKKPATTKSKAKAKPKTTTAAKSKPTATSSKKAAATKTKAKARRTPAGAKRDPILGIIYNRKPKEVDDLKQIKGVAKVIEGKLHSAGIYTYRQIVEWDAPAIEAFSEKLSFKGRIRNEGWQKQCAKFHKDKYGEKI